MYFDIKKKNVEPSEDVFLSLKPNETIVDNENSPISICL